MNSLHLEDNKIQLSLPALMLHQLDDVPHDAPFLPPDTVQGAGHAPRLLLGPGSQQPHVLLHYPLRTVHLVLSKVQQTLQQTRCASLNKQM